MEFEITTNLDAIRNQTIAANFDAVSAWLDEELKPYIGLVVTADAIPSAKNYRANLRKVKDRIEEYRKEVKRAALAPYNAFEEQAKVLTGKIDEAVANIDGQVKAFEQREADEKVAQIKAFYDDFADDEVMEYLPWGRVNNPKWRNKGYSVENAQADIQTQIGNVRDDLSAIRGMGDDDTAYLLDVYRETLDLSAVVRKASEVKATRQREELRVREEEAQRRQMEAARKAVREMTDAPQNDELVTVDFRVVCTKTQLSTLGQWMKRNGIKYGRCE